MDFIEKIFGFAPDGGDGSFELELVALAVIVISLVFLGRKLKRTLSR